MRQLPIHSSPSGKLLRALRLTGWNLLLVMAGMTLIGIAGEVYLRLTQSRPFTAGNNPRRFVPGVGRLLAPNVEVRHTNGLDYWTTSRTNSLGFLDREPPSPERAAASCHVAVIGDSVVAAREVPIADKFHVRLEELAARRLPRLDVTTSAFGIRSTGQINQLPFYDEYARRLRPDLLALVFVPNDLVDNSVVLQAAQSGWDPDRHPWTSAVRSADGTMKLRPPEPAHVDHLMSWTPLPRTPVFGLLWTNAKRSHLVNRLHQEIRPLLTLYYRRGDLRGRLELLSRRRPDYASLPGGASVLDGWRPATIGEMPRMFGNENLPPVFEEALDFTAFALDLFKERAERDGASLVILATHRMRRYGSRLFDRVDAMARERSIPVIDQHDHIVRSGGRIEDAQWAHDSHWNAAGHQWAAEALLEHLKRNPDVCREDGGQDSAGHTSNAG